MSRKKLEMKLIFWHADSMKACHKSILWFRWGRSSIPKVPKIASLQCLQYVKKEVRVEVDFLHAYKHQSFLLVDFDTLRIKVSYKVILSLLMSMIKHSQDTQNSKFAISSHYLEKKLKMGFISCIKINIKVSATWHNPFWWKWPDISKVPKIGSW